jgi:hypothetical protein
MCKKPHYVSVFNIIYWWCFDLILFSIAIMNFWQGGNDDMKINMVTWQSIDLGFSKAWNHNQHHSNCQGTLLCPKTNVIIIKLMTIVT